MSGKQKSRGKRAGKRVKKNPYLVGFEEKHGCISTSHMWQYQKLSNPQEINGVLYLTVHWETTREPVAFIGGDLATLCNAMDEEDATTLQNMLNNNPSLMEQFQESRTNEEEDKEEGDSD